MQTKHTRRKDGEKIIEMVTQRKQVFLFVVFFFIPFFCNGGDTIVNLARTIRRQKCVSSSSFQLEQADEGGRFEGERKGKPSDERETRSRPTGETMSTPDRNP